MAEASIPILELNGVGKEFAFQGQSIKALRGANLTVRKGEFICLLGASGCGKSTLLRIIAGFEKASQGAVEVYGTRVDGPGPDRGMVFQDYALFPWLTVQENIGFGPSHRRIASKVVAE